MIQRYFPKLDEQNTSAAGAILTRLGDRARRRQEAQRASELDKAATYRRRAAAAGKKAADPATAVASWSQQSKNRDLNRNRVDRIASLSAWEPRFVLYSLATAALALLPKDDRTKLQRDCERAAKQLQAWSAAGHPVHSRLSPADLRHFKATANRLNAISVAVSIYDFQPKSSEASSVDLGGRPTRTEWGLALMGIADYLRLVTGKPHWADLAGLLIALGLTPRGGTRRELANQIERAATSAVKNDVEDLAKRGMDHFGAHGRDYTGAFASRARSYHQLQAAYSVHLIDEVEPTERPDWAVGLDMTETIFETGETRSIPHDEATLYLARADVGMAASKLLPLWEPPSHRKR